MKPLKNNITNMSRLFHSRWDLFDNFNDNINDWDVSNVNDMSFMFSGCYHFNQPLNKWDVLML